MRAVNLIPDDQRAGRGGGSGRSEGAAYIVLGLLVGLALMVLMYGIARHQISDRRGEATKLTAKAQSAQAQAGQLAGYATFLSLHDERVNQINDLINTRFDWPHVFHELGRVLPTNVSLSSVQGQIATSGGTISSGAGAPATSSVSSATPPGSVPTLNITGCTGTQSEVAVAVSRLRLINGVTEVQLGSSTKGSGAGSGASGPCQPNSPVFTVVVTFSPLPQPSAPPAKSASGVTVSQPTQPSSAPSVQATQTVSQPTATRTPAAAPSPAPAPARAATTPVNGAS